MEYTNFDLVQSATVSSGQNCLRQKSTIKQMYAAMNIQDFVLSHIQTLVVLNSGYSWTAWNTLSSGKCGQWGKTMSLALSKETPASTIAKTPTSRRYRIPGGQHRARTSQTYYDGSVESHTDTHEHVLLESYART